MANINRLTQKDVSILLKTDILFFYLIFIVLHLRITFFYLFHRKHKQTFNLLTRCKHPAVISPFGIFLFSLCFQF